MGSVKKILPLILVLLFSAGCSRIESPLTPQEAKINGDWTEKFVHTDLNVFITDPFSALVEDTLIVHLQFSGNRYRISFDKIHNRVNSLYTSDFTQYIFSGTYRIDGQILYLKKDEAVTEEPYSYRLEGTKLMLERYPEHLANGTVRVQIGSSVWAYALFKYDGVLEFVNK